MPADKKKIRRSDEKEAEGGRDVADILASEAEDTERGRDMDAAYVSNRKRSKDPSQVYSIRFPVDRLEELRQVAARHGVTPSALLRRWTIERLDQEIDHDSRVEEERERRSVDRDEVIMLTRGQLESEIHRYLHDKGDLIARYVRERDEKS